MKILLTLAPLLESWVRHLKIRKVAQIVNSIAYKKTRQKIVYLQSTSCVFAINNNKQDFVNVTHENCILSSPQTSFGNVSDQTTAGLQRYTAYTDPTTGGS